MNNLELYIIELYNKRNGLLEKSKTNIDQQDIIDRNLEVESTQLFLGEISEAEYLEKRQNLVKESYKITAAYVEYLNVEEQIELVKVGIEIQ